MFKSPHTAPLTGATERVAQDCSRPQRARWLNFLDRLRLDVIRDRLSGGAQGLRHQPRWVRMQVARYMVERLMRRLGLRGVRRGKVVHHRKRQQGAMPAGQGQSAVTGRVDEPAVGSDFTYV